ncbi:hypothetical protein ACFT0G_28950 [Streptomyces sp. NPDC057020]|uniref:hypothetical protein n=1 Tax=unclassified Streptomyces TaxID=2593676 RepID=UPI00362D9561
MLTVLGILFAVAPTAVWTAIARTRLIGFAIGATLLAGAGLLISVQQVWIHAPRPDAHLVFTILAPALIVCGAGLERRHENSRPPEWMVRRNGAIGFLGMQFDLTLVVGLWYALLISEGSEAPPSKALPSLPPSISMISDGTSCGSGGCWRFAKVASRDDLSRPEIIRALGLQQERCRRNGWLLDQRDLCIGARDKGKNVIIYASLGY